MGGPDIPKEELLGLARVLHNFNPSGVHTVMNDLWKSSKLFGHIPIDRGDLVRILFQTTGPLQRKALINELRKIPTSTYREVFKGDPALEYALEVMEEGIKQL